MSPWSYPGVPAARGLTVARNDTRHVRAVAVIVVRIRIAADEVGEVCDALAGAGPVKIALVAVSEIVMPAGDARIDDRDADSGAVEAERAANDVGADRRAGPIHRRPDFAIEADLGKFPAGRERRDRGLGNFRGHGAKRRQPTAGSAAKAPNETSVGICRRTVGRLENHPNRTPRRAEALLKGRIELVIAALGVSRERGKRNESE